MVTFMCDACGMSVRKNQVEKHYMNQCRSCSVLSCIDCGKDFPGDAYKGHTSCITEAEKYQGHLYQEKENKGEAKQKAWTNQLQERTADVKDPKIARLIGAIAEYSNVPRKKKKFENFCKNSVKVHDQATLDKLWTAFMGDKPAANGTPATNGQTNGLTDTGKPEDDTAKPTNGTTAADSESENDNKNGSAAVKEESTKEKKKRKNKDEGKTKSKKKRKLEEAQQATAAASEVTAEEECDQPKKKKKKKKREACEHQQADKPAEESAAVLEEQTDIPSNAEVETTTCATPGGKFHWHKAIKTALRESGDDELPLKKLRRKVVAAYAAHGTDHRARSKEETAGLFDKKLKSFHKVKLDRDTVKLIVTT